MNPSEIQFDKERFNEFKDLQLLVRLAGELNRGSGVVEKINTLDNLEAHLTKGDYTIPRPSFMLWLEDLMIEINKAQQ